MERGYLPMKKIIALWVALLLLFSAALAEPSENPDIKSITYHLSLFSFCLPASWVANETGDTKYYYENGIGDISGGYISVNAIPKEIDEDMVSLALYSFGMDMTEADAYIDGYSNKAYTGFDDPARIIFLNLNLLDEPTACYTLVLYAQQTLFSFSYINPVLTVDALYASFLSLIGTIQIVAPSSTQSTLAYYGYTFTLPTDVEQSDITEKNDGSLQMTVTFNSLPREQSASLTFYAPDTSRSMEEMKSFIQRAIALDGYTVLDSDMAKRDNCYVGYSAIDIDKEDYTLVSVIAGMEESYLSIVLFVSDDHYDQEMAIIQTIYQTMEYNSDLSGAVRLTENTAGTVPADSNGLLDLSGMSYNDLVALKNKINLALWASDDWQEVSVPSGVYTVGENIPAGKWTIRADDDQNVLVYWGDTLDASGVSLSWEGDFYELADLYSPSNMFYKTGDKTEVTYTLKDGQYLIVDNGIAVFTPYSGSPDLGFKK